jgi:hypothetical protein
MARTDIHLDAMLRHLGAAYYESLHGRATRADVTRALSTVEEHLGEVGHHPGSGRPAGARHPAHEHGAGQHGDKLHPQGWSRRVRDVMTTSVVTVDRITPYKEIARLLAEHRVSGLPVLRMGRHVVGVVTGCGWAATLSAWSPRRTCSTRRSRRHGGSARRPAGPGGPEDSSTRS